MAKNNFVAKVTFKQKMAWNICLITQLPLAANKIKVGEC